MGSFHVERSIEIAAPPEKVFATIADFGTWKTWSPWLCAEPDAHVEVTADASSVGSVYSWRGQIVGEGEIEHRELNAPQRIEEEIRFAKPFKSKSRVEFEFEQTSEGTRVTWHMYGSLPWFLFFMRTMMVTFIGMDYERGLKMLKEWIETGEILSQTTIRGIEPVGPLRMAGIRNKCAMSEIASLMEEALCHSLQQFQDNGLPLDGQVMTVYHHFNFKTGTLDFTSGISLPDSVDVPPGMSVWSIPSVNALAVEHVGKYEHLGNAWSAAHQYARYHKLKQSKAGTFEIYRNNPEETPPAELRTDIYLPLK